MKGAESAPFFQVQGTRYYFTVFFIPALIAFFL